MKPGVRLLVLVGFAVSFIAGGVIGYNMARPAPKPEPVVKVVPSPSPNARPPIVLSDEATKASATLADAKAADTARTQAINRLLQEKAPGLDDTLLKVLDDPAENPTMKAVALQTLGRAAPPNETAVAKMQTYLDGADVTMRRLALQGLCRLKDPVGKETAVRWLNDDGKDANKVRDMAIYCVRDLGLKDQIPAIRKHARDGSDVIRMAALTVLAEWRDVESLDAMKEAAEAGSPALRKVGKEAVEKVGKP